MEFTSHTLDVKKYHTEAIPNSIWLFDRSLTYQAV